MPTADQIRRDFLEFFRERGHTVVPSAPVVPHDDPTLLFTNAGMNQFKDVFLATGSRPFHRAVDTQKCIRAGGKHNDLDDVGHDTYHHTFFEMLGNWSFGDYFKKEAIGWAWELLTKVWSIDKHRLHATYFQGDEHEGLAPDTEAHDLWLSVTDIDPANIHPGNKKDNFWEMGDTGPCGPCSEIHIDLTPDMSGASLVNQGDPRVMEIWNLVFIQFNRGQDGKLTPLPARHVDTGMGFERITAVLQGMQSGRLGQFSNYDTDIFSPIFNGIERVTGASPYTGLLESDLNQPLPHGRGSDPSSNPSPDSSNPSPDRKGGVPGPLAYLITFHTYGSWLHGTERGSVDREHNAPGEPFLDPDAQRERNEFIRLKHEVVVLDERRREVVARTIREVCAYRGWELHELNVRTNHVHLVVSADDPPEKVMNDLKSYATRRMVEARAFPSETKAWTRHGSTRYLWKPEAVASACTYVREGQGADLLPSASTSSDQPLPHGRGSDQVRISSNPSRDNIPSRDRKGAVGADRAAVMKDIAYRVIADHIRCLTFAITDGAVPSNEGRGYVLRRILRRAVRYGRQYLNVHEPFLCKLVPVVVEAMGNAFPELKAKPDRVSDLIRDEEESFIKTLDRGIALFEEAAERGKQSGRSVISGEDAFKLHDTYGFPIDLTEVMARERGMRVDISEYERLMEDARKRARASDRLDRRTAHFDFDVHRDEEKILEEATDDSHKYIVSELHGSIRAFIRFDENQYPYAIRNTVLNKGEEGGVILDKTCFYAEQGGQVGDTGLVKGNLATLEVQQTARWDKVVIHWGMVTEGAFHHGDVVTGRVAPNRVFTVKNHTATHVLNWALREVLEIGGGGKVDQKGSLVDPDKTRFDFSHNKPLTAEETERIEALCTQQLQADYLVYTKEVPQAEARKINTLRAVFGEKYPETVRVVSIGADIDAMLRDPQNPEWMKYSVEFCGGTHVKRTGEIGPFVLTAEESVAKGIRRVVGISGEKAQQAIEAGRHLRKWAASIRSGSEDHVSGGIAELQKKMADAEIPIRDRIALRELIAELQQIVKKQSKQQAVQTAGAANTARQQLLERAERVNGSAIIIGEMPEVPVEQIREAADWLRTQAGSAAVLLGARTDGKPLLIAAMTDDLIAKGLKAGDLIKHVVPAIDGRGGGKPNLAQAGGNNPDGIPAALEAAKAWIRSKLG